MIQIVNVNSCDVQIAVDINLKWNKETKKPIQIEFEIWLS